MKEEISEMIPCTITCACGENLKHYQINQNTE